MGFWSNMFGQNKEKKALQEVLGQIHGILNDEQYQLEIIHPLMKEMVEKCPAYDRVP